QLDRGEGELVAEFGIGAAEFLGDAMEGGIDGETRLGADHQQVECVRQTLADCVGALGDLVLEENIRRLVRQDKGDRDDAVLL
nr:hypothetical protein [Tanacetum cinerariifolium]